MMNMMIIDGRRIRRRGRVMTMEMINDINLIIRSIKSEFELYRRKNVISYSRYEIQKGKRHHSLNNNIGNE